MENNSMKPREVEYGVSRKSEEAAAEAQVKAAEEARIAEEAKAAEEARIAGEANNANNPVDLDDDVVLSHIRKKFEREDLTYDDLLAEKTIEAELPEDLEALRRFKKETGRGISDFVKLNRDIEAEDPDSKIAEFIAAKNPEFDKEDVAFEMERNFGINEMDDDDEIRIKKIEKKKMLAQADSFLNEQKEKYKAPLESREGFIPESELETYQKYKENTENQNKQREKTAKNQEYFSAKTNELFSSTFEGFEYGEGESKVKFKSGDTEAIKKAQSDATNFINSHLDETGKVKDAAAYHKALNAAMDPDGLWKFAYEQGAADAIKKDTKEAKNIAMKARIEEQRVNGTFKAREVSSDGSGNRIKVRKPTS